MPTIMGVCHRVQGFKSLMFENLATSLTIKIYTVILDISAEGQTLIENSQASAARMSL
jgi:hypothetical protein